MVCYSRMCAYIKDGQKQAKIQPILPLIAILLPLIHQNTPFIGCGCVGYCVVFRVCYSASIESKRKGAKVGKVKGLQILAVVAIVTGFVWAGIGVVGQVHGLIQLGAIIAAIGMVAAVLSVLLMEC